MPDGNIQLSTDAATGDMIYEYPDTATTSVAAGEQDHFGNLSMSLEKRTIDSLCDTLTELVTYDEDGRRGWMDIGKDAYNLLGVGPESDPDNADDPNADTSDHPLMLTALTRFQSKAYAALLPSGDRAVRAEPAVYLDDIEDPKEREKVQQDCAEAGARVERFYTYYLFERLDTYETDTDQILHDCGMMGVGIRKIFTDRSRKNTPVRPVLVNLSDLIISYDASSFTSGRITHRIKMPTSELIRMIQSGQYRNVGNLIPEHNSKTDLEREIDRVNGLLSGDLRDDETHTLYEIHCDLRLTEDRHPMGLARPYIVTVHAASREVLAIVRNWEPDDPDEDRIEHFVAYPFSPGKSATTPMGLGHLLSNITRALRDAQRAGLDAGYLQNHPSGFKLASFKLRDDSSKIRSGEFVDVDSPTDDIRKAIQLHPFQGPSPGLMALAEKMEANGKELGGIASIDFAQLMKAGVAAGPAMAAYEESATFQTAIHRRLYKAMSTELRMIHARMRQIHGNAPVLFGTNGVLRPGDLTKVNILPAMKPGEISKQKTLLEAQALWDMSKQMPDIISPRKAAMKMLRALGEPNIDDILVPDPEENPPEPAEYGMVLQGQPVKAGMSQNHQAHIDSHSAQMKMLLTSQLPVEKGEAAMAALAAHIAEHMAQQVVVEVSMRVGIPPEQFAQGIPPQLEAMIAPQIAKAIQQIEQERAPAEGDGGEKIAVEQIKQQGKQVELTLKARHDREMADLKHRQALELQTQKDDAQMKREEADNEAALEIAAMKGGTASNAQAGARANAGAGAGAKSVASAGSGETK
jgi:hypothetical protein